MNMAAESIESLESLCEERPGSLAFARLASLYLDKGDTDRAVQLCIDGLKRYPNYTSARLVLGRCYAQKGRWQDAATEFRRACRIDRRSRTALKQLADVLVQLQQGAVAGDIYAYLLECDPDNVELQRSATAVPGHAPQDIQAVLEGIPQGAPVPPRQAAPAPAPVVQAPVPPPAPAAPPRQDQTEVDLAALRPPAQPQPPSAPPAQPGPGPAAHTADDVKAFADLIENAETIALAPSSPARSGDITGQDVSYRIDSLFGADAKSVQGPAEKAAAPLHDQDALTALFAAGQTPEGSSLDTGRFKMDEIAPDVLPAAPLEGKGAEADADSFGATMAFESPLFAEETVEGSAPAETEPPLPKPELKAEPPFAPARDERPAGPSGTDVSSRLEEMFDFDAAFEPQPSGAQPAQPEAVAPPAADQAPIEGVSDEHIETAVVGSDIAFLDNMTAESDKTAVLSPEEQTALLAKDVTEEPPEETVAVEPPQESGQPEDQPTSLLADHAATAQFDTEATRAVADGLLAPSEETAALSLDQEMSFAGAATEQHAVDEAMAAPPAADDSTPTEIAEEIAPSAPEEAMGAGIAAPAAAEEAPLEASPAEKDSEDIFSETWLAGDKSGEEAPAAQPQTLEERAEEAQTLAFARDELEDMVAISQETETGVDKRGDTTTIASLSALEDETQDLTPAAAGQAAPPAGGTDDQTAEMGFQEIRLEEPVAPPAGPRIVGSDTSQLPHDLLSAQTSQYPVQSPAQQPANPFEAYAQEISQAQTILFRRQDLDKMTVDAGAASNEEQADLTDQVSKAQTVEFGRDQLKRLSAAGTPPPPESAPAAPEPAEQPISLMDTGPVFLDEITGETVEQAPPAAALPPHEAETVLTEAPAEPAPAGAASDPFLAETLEMAQEGTDTVVSPIGEPVAGSSGPDKRPPRADETGRPPVDVPETVVVDRTELLPSAELVWEEGPAAQTPAGKPRGDLAETVAMTGSPAASELERTERMEPLAGEPSDKEREDQLASIPDHVLTPTLADIYYHQGQPKLAVHIYRRLLQLHPADTRIAARIAEIEASMTTQPAAATATAPAATRAPAPVTAAGSARVKRGRRKPKPHPPRPLAGVRIKKAYRERYLRRKHGLRP